MSRLAAARRLLSRHRWFAAAAAGGLMLRVLTVLAFPPACAAALASLNAS